MTKPKILVSACLLGRPVRYDGSAKTLVHQALERWKAEDRLVTLCPELAAGFSTPRPQAEIDGGQSGREVLSGRARVIEATGADVTDLYIVGAQAALLLAQANDCRFALLADGSPSCGSRSSTTVASPVGNMPAQASPPRFFAKMGLRFLRNPRSAFCRNGWRRSVAELDRHFTI
jgi:uncharacterized protein YbbK (DUF523 family)